MLSAGRFKPVALRSYETGSRSLTVEKAAELAALYDVSLAELLCGQPMLTGQAELAGGR